MYMVRRNTNTSTQSLQQDLVLQLLYTPPCSTFPQLTCCLLLHSVCHHSPHLSASFTPSILAPAGSPSHLLGACIMHSPRHLPCCTHMCMLFLHVAHAVTHACACTQTQTKPVLTWAYSTGFSADGHTHNVCCHANTHAGCVPNADPVPTPTSQNTARSTFWAHSVGYAFPWPALLSFPLCHGPQDRQHTSNCCKNQDTPSR